LRAFTVVVELWRRVRLLLLVMDTSPIGLCNKRIRSLLELEALLHLIDISHTKRNP